MRVPLLPPLESRDSVGNKDSLGVNVFLEQEDQDTVRAVKRAGILAEISGAGIPGAGTFSYGGNVYVWDTSTTPTSPSILTIGSINTVQVVSDVAMSDDQYRFVTVRPATLFASWVTGDYFSGASIPLTAGTLLSKGTSATSPPIAKVGATTFTYRAKVDMGLAIAGFGDIAAVLSMGVPVLIGGRIGTTPTLWDASYSPTTLLGGSASNVNSMWGIVKVGFAALTPCYWDASNALHSLPMSIFSNGAANDIEGDIIVGYEYNGGPTSTYAVKWVGGVETVLNSGVFNVARANAIANSVIYGSVNTDSGDGYGARETPCYWDSGAILHLLSPNLYGVVLGAHGNTAVGYTSTRAWGGSITATVWNGGIATYLSLPSGGTDAYATAISGALIVGYALIGGAYRAVKWSGGVPITLPYIGGQTYAYATNGTVTVGSSNNQPCYWDAVGNIHALSAIGGGSKATCLYKG
jgi:hypothetical protein